MKNITKKKLIRGLIVTMLAVGLLVSLAGCELFFSVLTQPSGKVVDAKTGEGIELVKVTLTFDTTVASEKDKENVSSTGTYTAITTTTGAYSWANETDTVPYGTYTLSATKDGYVFFSREITISGLAPDLGTLIGLPATVGTTDISFILLWNDGFHDVDAYLTYPKPGVPATSGGVSPVFSDPYSAPTSNYSSWFSPDTFTIPEAPAVPDRRKIYFSAPSTASDADVADWNPVTHVNTLNKGTNDFDSDSSGSNDTYKIELDVDASLGGGPESITVRTFPWAENGEGYNTTLLTGTGLPSGSTYAWVGVMEYYISAFENDYDSITATSDYLSTNNGTDVTSADAVLYVLQGTTILGKYTVPEYTNVKTASLVRVNCFWKNDGVTEKEFYQIVPDLRVLQSVDGIKSIDNSYGIITATGKTR
jgi:hypothetical protein